MNVSGIKYCDIANGVGVRTTLFVSGCRHGCEGCFNPETWPFEAGEPFTSETIADIVASLGPDYVAGLTLLGGEPLEPENQPAVLELLREVRRACPSKSVWAYTGFTFEELMGGHSRASTEHVVEILSLVDVLVDGRFVLKLKDIGLRFRGSTNQRIIDVPQSLAAGKAIAWVDDPTFATRSVWG